MCPPAIIVGVLSAGLGFVQHQQSVRAQNDAIEVSNQNAIFSHEHSKLQTEANRFRETQQEMTTDLANADAEYMAARAWEMDTSFINLQIAQAQEEAGIKKREKKLETTRAKGEILATGKGGLNIVNLLTEVDSQWGQFDWNVNRNLAFTGAQADSDKRSTNTRRASRLAQISPYVKQTFIDRPAPILQRKRSMNTGLALLSAGLQGASAGMNWSSAAKGAGYEWKGWKGGGYHYKG